MAKNKLTIKVDADTTEALKQMKEVTEAANECVGALEKLEKAMGKFRFNREPIRFDIPTSFVGSEIHQTADAVKLKVGKLNID
ncbi:MULTISPECIES: hypothetical protein [Bacillales]|uniref:hypothetical protein n=1 Tax=Bacillales TaxID=1385 RepID=UPI00190D9DC5|nr:hypothetical protein [Staphylococcus aureus]MBK3312606.1 hypothetical protein [Staphylococcus aureus]WAI29919.1 MAG: hypothetical protein NRZ50_30700 [Bacillus paranthracis]WAI35766.1 MAG: hypothetical protein NRZ52_30345 [Bacillus paranthracis]WAI41563.1 MAG: hypothetical protein NRZ51_30630 [Bacillus paranthracis]